MSAIWSTAATSQSLTHDSRPRISGFREYWRRGDDTSHGRISSDRFSPEVMIDNFAFSPVTITVKPRTEATWTKCEDNFYSVDRAHGKLNSVALHTYQILQFRFTEPGENYHYRVHPKTSGTIVVRLW